MKLKISLAVIALALAATVGWRLHVRGGAPEAEDAARWRRVLSFDVTQRDRDFKADLENHQMVVARHARPVGWEIAVYAYPVTADSENLLAGGAEWRGPQPWHSFAMTRRRRLYPDVRLLDYGPRGQKLKIVLLDCKTERHAGFARFTQGRIEVFYHSPNS